MLTAVTGLNWGDEGKGRVIDLLAQQADVVVRYQAATTPAIPWSPATAPLCSTCCPRGFSTPGSPASWGTGWWWIWTT